MTYILILTGEIRQLWKEDGLVKKGVKRQSGFRLGHIEEGRKAPEISCFVN
jgi:hypothetical protein